MLYKEEQEEQEDENKTTEEPNHAQMSDTCQMHQRVNCLPDYCPSLSFLNCCHHWVFHCPKIQHQNSTIQFDTPQYNTTQHK